MLGNLSWLIALLGWMPEQSWDWTYTRAEAAAGLQAASVAGSCLGGNKRLKSSDPCSASGTLPPPLRRLDGYRRTSEAFEAQTHGR